MTNEELNALHAEGLDHPCLDDDWVTRLERHSLGWVVARDDDGQLVGFVNVAWDGGVHAFVLDTLVAASHRHRGIGQALVRRAVDGAREAGCAWLHVDWDGGLDRFYLDRCGFVPTAAGLHRLR
ncbi:GNAT family N-acetyltransferase [Egicoccus halophilus]|uniref:GNAT family N-acetyltransferase n=1 Tax=Egicoccus halophilus TaxID=1670830 RepID=UPI00197A85BA|nr:GNAT family N-acetyltransferase [Egicoccus halophilus]